MEWSHFYEARHSMVLDQVHQSPPASSQTSAKVYPSLDALLITGKYHTGYRKTERIAYVPTPSHASEATCHGCRDPTVPSSSHYMVTSRIKFRLVPWWAVTVLRDLDFKLYFPLFEYSCELWFFVSITKCNVFYSLKKGLRYSNNRLWRPFDICLIHLLFLKILRIPGNADLLSLNLKVTWQGFKIIYLFFVFFKCILLFKKSIIVNE